MKTVLLVILSLFMFGFEVGDYVETTPEYAKTMSGEYHRGVIIELDDTTNSYGTVATVVFERVNHKHQLNTYWLQEVQKAVVFLDDVMVLYYCPGEDKKEYVYGVVEKEFTGNGLATRDEITFFNTTEEVNKYISDRFAHHNLEVGKRLLNTVFKMEALEIETVEIDTKKKINRIKEE